MPAILCFLNSFFLFLFDRISAEPKENYNIEFSDHFLSESYEMGFLATSGLESLPQFNWFEKLTTHNKLLQNVVA